MLPATTQECHSERRLATSPHPPDPPSTDGSRAPRRPAHTGRSLSAAARPGPGVPARVGRAWSTGRALLVPGRRLSPDSARRRAGRRPVRAAARGPERARRRRRERPAAVRRRRRRLPGLRRHPALRADGAAAGAARRRPGRTRPLPAGDRRGGVRPRAPHRLGHRHAGPRPRGRRGRERPARRPAARRRPGAAAEQHRRRARRGRPGRVRGDGRAGPAPHRGRRRVPDRRLTAPPAPDGVHAVRDLPGPAGDQPVAVHGLPGLREPADRLVLARDPRGPRRRPAGPS